jgi:hypothetical protein
MANIASRLFHQFRKRLIFRIITVLFHVTFPKLVAELCNGRHRSRLENNPNGYENNHKVPRNFHELTSSLAGMLKRYPFLTPKQTLVVLRENHFFPATALLP